MTLRDMLGFAGGVLGPALVAQELGNLLHAVPGAAPARRTERQPDPAEQLLRRAFPDGLPSV